MGKMQRRISFGLNNVLKIKKIKKIAGSVLLSKATYYSES